MMCSRLAESPINSASQMMHVVMARLLRLCTTLPRGRLPAPLLATTDFHCLLENGIGTMSGSLRLPNRFSSRRNPKPITDSGVKPITQSGQADHLSERSDAGVRLCRSVIGLGQ